MKILIEGEQEAELQMVKFMKMEELFKLAGLNYTKFDTACPQSFFNAKNALGIKDVYGWTYEDAGIMGRPLSMLAVFERLRDKLCIIETKEPI